MNTRIFEDLNFIEDVNVITDEKEIEEFSHRLMLQQEEEERQNEERELQLHDVIFAVVNGRRHSIDLSKVNIELIHQLNAEKSANSYGHDDSFFLDKTGPGYQLFLTWLWWNKCDEDSNGIINPKLLTEKTLATLVQHYFDIKIISGLLELKVSPDSVNESGYSALYLAAQHGNKDIAVKLIEAKASLELANRLGKTPLYVSMSPNTVSTFNTLLSAGSIFHDGQAIFDFFKTCDQRNLEIMEGLNILSERLENDTAHAKLLGDVQTYIKKLQKLNNLYSYEFARRMEIDDLLPSAVTRIIANFDLSSRLTLFQPKDIDLLIEQAEKEKSFSHFKK